MQDEKIENASKAEPELDIGSEQFNAQRALDLEDLRVAKRQPKVQYQNLAAFESALNRVGLWELNVAKATATATKAIVASDDTTLTNRRFLPHQMAIRTNKRDEGANVRGQRHRRNLFTYMQSVEGPLQQLQHWRTAQQRVCVVLRNEHGIRGTLTGELHAFDKQWNLLLVNVIEIRQRRKYKYGVNKLCALTPPQDCTNRLKDLGIVLPATEVKSLNRKNVQITRHIAQLFLRGEHIVLVRPQMDPPKTNMELTACT